MSSSQLPRLLFTGFKNTFFESLSSRFPKNAIEVVFRDMSSLSLSPEETSSGEVFDYVVIDCFSSESGTLFFLRNTELFDFIATESEKQSRILILLPHTVTHEMQMHIETKLHTFLSQHKTVGILFIARLLDENIATYFPIQGNTVQFPHETSLFSLIRTQDALSGIERNIFSLKAYGHTQSLYGIVTKPGDLSGFFEKKGYQIQYNNSFRTDVLLAQEVILKPFSLEKIMEEIPAVTSI